MQISLQMATQHAIAVKVERCSRLWTFEIHNTAYNRSKHHIKGYHRVEWGGRIRNIPNYTVMSTCVEFSFALVRRVGL